MARIKLTPEQKQANKEARKAAREKEKEIARIEREKNQKPVSSISISIEWKKSRIWGSNPHAEAHIRHKDGSHSYASATCSGCGYDKESTVIADIFNQFLKYKLWQLSGDNLQGGNGSLDKGNAPYGIAVYGDGSWRHFAGGIGTNCYYDIAKHIGGEFKRVASGKSYDAYEYTDLS